MKNQLKNYLKYLKILFLPLCLVSVSENLYAHPCRKCTQELSSPKTCIQCGIARYCNQTCQKADWADHKTECKRIAPSTHLKDRVRISKSLLPDAGLGIFSEQDLPRGSELTAYYGTIVEDSLRSRFKYGSHTYLQPIVSNFLHSRLKLEPIAFSEFLIIGNPEAPAAHLAAQLVNDPYVSLEDLSLLFSVPCSEMSDRYLEKIKEFAQKYMAQWVDDRLIFLGKKPGISKANIDLETMIDASYFPRMIARRDIKKEELYYDYGIEYWLGIPISICNKKGMPEGSLDIERAFSKAVDEDLSKSPFLYSQLKTQSLNYLSEDEYEEQREIYQANVVLQMVRLFGSANMNVIAEEANPTILALKEFTPLRTLVAELKKIPNQEFYDQHHYGKAHPKSIELFKAFVEHLKSLGIDQIPTFQDPVTGEIFRWEDLLDIVIDKP